jgi:hypothetical protein
MLKQCDRRRSKKKAEAKRTSRRQTVKAILKWPLILAAIIVVLRVVTERAGVPYSINNLLCIVALHTLILPLYFAIRIAKNGVERPYVTLFKLVALYAVLTRLMVIPVYWLARVYEWTQPRFAGLWGPDVSPFVGYIAVPFITAAFWIVGSVVIGGALGSAVIAAVRTERKPSAKA